MVKPRYELQMRLSSPDQELCQKARDAIVTFFSNYMADGPLRLVCPDVTVVEEEEHGIEPI